MDEKLKRYKNCEIAYNQILGELDEIQKRIQFLNMNREELKEDLENLRALIMNFINVTTN